MKIQDVLELIAAGEKALSRPCPKKELITLKRALKELGDLSIVEFCEKLRDMRRPPTRKVGKPKPSVNMNSEKVKEFLTDYRYTMDHLLDAAVSYQTIAELTGRLQTRDYSKEEVLAIVEECGVFSARSKKQAAEKLRQKLVDLKATLSKAPM